jgi:hypothetical protein
MASPPFVGLRALGCRERLGPHPANLVEVTVGAHVLHQRTRVRVWQRRKRSIPRAIEHPAQHLTPTLALFIVHPSRNRVVAKIVELDAGDPYRGRVLAVERPERLQRQCVHRELRLGDLLADFADVRPALARFEIDDLIAGALPTLGAAVAHDQVDEAAVW